MAAANDDFFADARARMVDSQLRPNRVTDPRILHAMRTLPRERFLPKPVADLAYVDEDVPLGNGRFEMEPMVLARLIQAAAPVSGETALVVAAATGYGAAVLASCGVRVTALEEDPQLASLARSTLAEIAPSVTVVSGRHRDGAPSGAPFDIILIEGAVQEIPPALVKQLREERGRLVTVLAAPGPISYAVLAELTSFGLRSTPIFDCATPLLASLAAPPTFVF
jgi:protein-L-isoaspartate(D-aspartate) O-methyltransferase